MSPIKIYSYRITYLAINTRPDLAFIVSFLSQYNIDYTKMKWKMLKRVFRYLNNTRILSIIFRSTEEEITRYVDADYANDQEEGKS